MGRVVLARGEDPYFGWTEEKTRDYIEQRPLARGDQMLIVNRQGGLEEYVLAQVIEPDSGRQHRVVLDREAAWGGRSFFRSGKNCFSPKGQSRMIPPVPEVVVEMERGDGNVPITSNRFYGLPFAPVKTEDGAVS